MRRESDKKNTFGKPEKREFRAKNTEEREIGENVVFGRNPVLELLASGRDAEKIFVRKGEKTGSVNLILAKAKEAGIPVIDAEAQKLDALAGGMPHQGVVALAAGKEYCSVDDILAIAAERGEKPLILISDGIDDPHNLGAIIRTAELTGAHGLLIPKRRAVGLTAIVEKASAGALEHFAVAKISNIAQTLEELKEKGLWIFCAEAGGERYDRADFDCPMALVLGSEGFGVSRLVREKCDFTVSIPMRGKINSYNVSSAAAILLCETQRQRYLKA